MPVSNVTAYNGGDRRAGPQRQLVAGQLPGLPAVGDLQQHRSGSGCHNRSIEWTVNDGALDNPPLADFTTLSVTPVNDRPVIDLNGAGVGNEGINNTRQLH